jgi:hypothetical protein
MGLPKKRANGNGHALDKAETEAAMKTTGRLLSMVACSIGDAFVKQTGIPVTITVEMRSGG